MKRLIQFFFLLVFCISAFSLEIGASFHCENLSFQKSRTESEQDLSGVAYTWGLSIFAVYPINNNMTLNTAYRHDEILRNVSYAVLNIDYGQFAISIGPMLGFFNHGFSPVLKPGLSSSVTVEFGQFAFIKLQADTSINTRLSVPGDYIQEYSLMQTGLFLENIIPSISMENKTFVQKTVNGELVDSQNLYSFQNTLKKEGVPFELSIRFVFQQLTRTWRQDAAPASLDIHQLSSIILGTDITYRILNTGYVFFNLDSNIYSFGNANDKAMILPKTLPGLILFKSHVGYVHKF